MVFSSPIFLFAFLPLVFLFSFLGRNIKYKNAVLVVASLIFYAFGQLGYVPIFILSIFINYLSGLMIAKMPRHKKPVLIVSVILNLGILGVYKYADFLISNWNYITGSSVALPGITLPIGISFFTFQGLSYTIDVYRNPECGTRNFFKMFLYIAFFPQLIAGPIVKYHDIAHQIDHRECNSASVSSGICRLCIGLAKKVLVSNTLGKTADAIINGIVLPVAGFADFRLAWLGAICYMLQIYYDFGGYSDMAIGLGRIFGFRFDENFDHPYSALSIREFWRKWHISLSSWFREYLYIPLGGNRKGKTRTILNRMAVFLCTGIWHGANWTFILWGIFHGLLSCGEDLGIIPVKKLSQKRAGRFVCRVYTMLSVMLLFVLFRADSVHDAFEIIGTMFLFKTQYSGALLLHTLAPPAVILTLIIAVLSAGNLPKLLANRSNLINSACQSQLIRYSVCIALYVLTVMSLANGGYNPFIYFQF